MKQQGKLFFYSETGTEGGHWAFQESGFISLRPPVFGVSNDTRVWDAADTNKAGQSSNAEVNLDNQWLPIPDPIVHDPDYEISSLFRGEQRGDFLADERLMKRYGFKIKYFGQAGRTPESEPSRPYGIPLHGSTRVTVTWADGEVEYRRLSNTLLIEHWDPKGTHLLETGDRLEILDPNTGSVVWEGTVELRSYSIFTEHARGFWIHTDQQGISREDWSNYFFKNYEARLIRLEAKD